MMWLTTVKSAGGGGGGGGGGEFGGGGLLETADWLPPIPQPVSDKETATTIANKTLDIWLL